MILHPKAADLELQQNQEQVPGEPEALPVDPRKPVPCWLQQDFTVSACCPSALGWTRDGLEDSPVALMICVSLDVAGDGA